MSDAERYRHHAVDCLNAAKEASEPYCRRLHLALAASWLTLASQDDTVSELLSSWGIEATVVDRAKYDADGAASA
jgi:hypothetical protein